MKPIILFISIGLAFLLSSNGICESLTIGDQRFNIIFEGKSHSPEVRKSYVDDIRKFVAYDTKYQGDGQTFACRYKQNVKYAGAIVEGLWLSGVGVFPYVLVLHGQDLIVAEVELDSYSERVGFYQKYSHAIDGLESELEQYSRSLSDYSMSRFSQFFYLEDSNVEEVAILKMVDRYKGKLLLPLMMKRSFFDLPDLEDCQVAASVSVIDEANKAVIDNVIFVYTDTWKMLVR